jgi:hypothetical protein
MPTPASLEPAQDVAFTRTPSSRRWMQHLLVPLEPASGVVTLNARADQDCRSAFAQGVLDDRRLSSSNLREHPKLAQGPATAWPRDGVLAIAPLSLSEQKQTSFARQSTKERRNK